MSGLPSEPLKKGGPMCPYYPYCVASHKALQCVRLTALLKEHREPIDRDRKICLRCRERGVDADGICVGAGTPLHQRQSRIRRRRHGRDQTGL